MSGYLARLAARAGGAPATAGPRLPSRFESSGGGEPTSKAVPSLPMDAPERAAARATERGAAPDVAERTDAERVTTGLHLPRAPRRDAPAPAAPETEASSHITSTPTDDDGRLSAVDAGQSPTIAVPALRRTVSSAAPRVEAAPPPRVEAAPPPRVEAAPPPTTPARLAALRDEASSSASEPDVVHVTIGRVDVRATIAPTTATPRAPRPPRDAERSLHDYLAGRTR